MIFDSHTHIQFPIYDLDRDDVMARAAQSGVKMIVAGTQIESSRAAITLARAYPEDVWATVGFHPSHTLPTTASAKTGWRHDPIEQKSTEQEKFSIEALRTLAADPKVVAIGECGLDYYRITVDVLRIKEEQKRVFLAQAEVAKELNKPLMIHARASRGTDDAYEDVFNMLRTPNLRLPTILHFYAGSLAVTKKLVDAGCYFTFGGVITFAHDYDKTIKYIPMSQILLETDAPYVAPVPYRDMRNEPSYIIKTAERMAEVKGVPLEDVITATTANALAVFKILI